MILYLKFRINNLLISAVLLCAFMACRPVAERTIEISGIYCRPLLVGEATQTSAIFQARLTDKDTLIYEDIQDAAYDAQLHIENGDTVAFQDDIEYFADQMKIKVDDIKMVDDEN